VLPNRSRITDASANDEDGDEELDDAVWDGNDGGLNFQPQRPQRPDNRRRLSRELEEGFRDSSDDEDDET
jgi:hypothetical protein